MTCILPIAEKLCKCIQGILETQMWFFFSWVITRQTRKVHLSHLNISISSFFPLSLAFYISIFFLLCSILCSFLYSFNFSFLPTYSLFFLYSSDFKAFQSPNAPIFSTHQHKWYHYLKTHRQAEEQFHIWTI